MERELERVREVMPLAAVDFTFIVRESGVDSGEVAAALLMLELKGMVTQLPGNKYVRLG
jgi:predicted Rossmann fold nucleotide-binding protein DprA/Smf involved in DNA uptake